MEEIGPATGSSGEQKHKVSPKATANGKPAQRTQTTALPKHGRSSSATKNMEQKTASVTKPHSDQNSSSGATPPVANGDVVRPSSAGKVHLPTGKKQAAVKAVPRSEPPAPPTAAEKDKVRHYHLTSVITPYMPPFSHTLTHPHTSSHPPHTPSHALTHPHTPSHTLTPPHTSSHTLTHPHTLLTHPHTPSDESGIRFNAGRGQVGAPCSYGGRGHDQPVRAGGEEAPGRPSCKSVISSVCSSFILCPFPSSLPPFLPPSLPPSLPSSLPPSLPPSLPLPLSLPPGKLSPGGRVLFSS